MATFSADTTPPPRLIARPEVLERLSMCTSKLYVLMSAGKFARPIKTGRSSRWLESDVTAYIAKVAAVRDTAAPRAAPGNTAHQAAASLVG